MTEKEKQSVINLITLVVVHTMGAHGKKISPQQAKAIHQSVQLDCQDIKAKLKQADTDISKTIYPQISTLNPFSTITFTA